MAIPSPNKNKRDSADKAKSELKDDFEEINSLKMCSVLLSSLRISLCLNSFLKITNFIILKLLNIYSSFDFEILSWSINQRAKTFKIEPMIDHDCS